jgi:hypothetical protein
MHLDDGGQNFGDEMENRKGSNSSHSSSGLLPPDICIVIEK